MTNKPEMTAADYSAAVAVGLLSGSGVVTWGVLQLYTWHVGTGRWTLSQLHAVCDSSLGVLGQMMSQGAANDCRAADIGYWLMQTAGLLGLAGIVLTALMVLRRHRSAAN